MVGGGEFNFVSDSLLFHTLTETERLVLKFGLEEAQIRHVPLIVGD